MSSKPKIFKCYSLFTSVLVKCVKSEAIEHSIKKCGFKAMQNVDFDIGINEDF